MQAIVEFSATKSCPDLSPDEDSLYNSLSRSTASTDHLHRALSFPLVTAHLSQSLCRDSGHEVGVATTGEEDDDVIEILSTHHLDTRDQLAKAKLASVSIKLVNGHLLAGDDDDPTNVQRKRVARAVCVVTFLLVLFSVVLIGVSLNMGKSIDDMVRASTVAIRHQNFVSKRGNTTDQGGT